MFLKLSQAPSIMHAKYRSLFLNIINKVYSPKSLELRPLLWNANREAKKTLPLLQNRKKKNTKAAIKLPLSLKLDYLRREKKDNPTPFWISRSSAGSVVGVSLSIVYRH